MKKFLWSTSLLTLLIFSPNSWAQEPNILDTMLRTQDAVVSIKSDLRSVYKSPKTNLVFDKQAGRFIARRKLATANYTRFGAGVVIHPSGIIVTNAHIVNLANSITVGLYSNETRAATILKVVKDLDIAFIGIPVSQTIDAVEFADSDAIKLGDEVITIGNSEFLKQTVTGGRIRGIGSSRSLNLKRTDLIQTSINLYEGDSGGPLFNDQGQLIGLMTAKETAADRSSFAIPSNKIKKYLVEYLQQLKEKRKN